MSAAATVTGFVRATHPLPTVAVTGFFTALGVAAGLGPGGLATLAAAVLVGQASVGWANDAIDAERDRVVGRLDKPVAAGVVRRGSVLTAAKLALAADVPLSLALGWRAGAAHLVAVGWAWLYDCGLKATVMSPLPYVVSFGLVPFVVSESLPGAPTPRPLLVVVAACCGVAAHFANTIGDAGDDAATGVRGLPQRLGERGSVLVAAAFVAAAAGLLLAAVGAGVFALVAAIGAIGCAVATVAALRAEAGRRQAFRLVIAAVAFLVVGFLVAGGNSLVRA